MEINLDEARGPIREWIAQEPVRREVARRFARLLRTFTDDSGDAVYRQRVRDMCRGEPTSPLRPVCLPVGVTGGSARHACLLCVHAVCRILQAALLAHSWLDRGAGIRALQCLAAFLHLAACGLLWPGLLVAFRALLCHASSTCAPLAALLTATPALVPPAHGSTCCCAPAWLSAAPPAPALCATPRFFAARPADNKSTLEVNYLDIANTMPVVAIWLADHPREMLPILGEAAK